MRVWSAKSFVSVVTGDTTSPLDIWRVSEVVTDEVARANRSVVANVSLQRR